MTTPNQPPPPPCRPRERTFDPLARQAGSAARPSGPFAVYNDLREHPTDGRRLLRLPQMDEALAEPAEAEAAARHLPLAMAAEPECAAMFWSGSGA